MRVLCFGSYDPANQRTRVLLRGLDLNGVEVRHCNVGPGRLPVAYGGLTRRFDPDVDALLVLHPGHHFVPLARALGWRRRIPVVFDALVSLYDTFVSDRKIVERHSAGSLRYALTDRVSCGCATTVVLDTNEHLRYFHETFGIPLSKMRRVPVGTDDEVFHPIAGPPAEPGFDVCFVGTFIPLHGIEHIVRAAKLLEDESGIRFTIIGRGQTFPEMAALARDLGVRNVDFEDPVPFEALPQALSRADVCLGIFGDTDKARRVVPGKAFNALAMAKPLLTGSSPAMEELGFRDRVNARLIEMGSPAALAEAILELREDETLRRSLAANGLALFRERFTPRAIGATLKAVLTEALETPAG